MKNFFSKMNDKVEQYAKNNKKFTYVIESCCIICYYNGEQFLQIYNDGWIFLSNLNGEIHVDNCKGTLKYKLFYASEIMLFGETIKYKYRE